MNQTDEDFSSSRIGDGTPAEAKYIDTLMEQLLELRDRTDPAKRVESERLKEAYAFRALRLAGKLVDVLAGWAIDHNVGMALEGLEFLGLTDQQTAALPEYQTARAKVDSHRHELAGSRITRGAGTVDPEVARRIAINLLHPNAGGWPPGVACELRDALRGLAINDVQPIIRSSSRKQKMTLEQQRLRMLAIGFVHFRTATGLMSAEAALERVARAYGVGVNTVKSWETRLRKKLGKVVYSREVETARNGASYIVAKPQEMSEAIAAMESDSRHGNVALDAAGERHKKVRRR